MIGAFDVTAPAERKFHLLRQVEEFFRNCHHLIHLAKKNDYQSQTTNHLPPSICTEAWPNTVAIKWLNFGQEDFLPRSCLTLSCSTSYSC